MAEKKCLNCGKIIQSWHERCPFCRAEQDISRKEDSESSVAESNKFVVNIDEKESTVSSPVKNNKSKEFVSGNTLDQLAKRIHRIDDTLLTIKGYLKFFVILTVIALAIYLISLIVSCHAANNAADELSRYYSFIPFS